MWKSSEAAMSVEHASPLTKARSLRSEPHRVKVNSQLGFTLLEVMVALAVVATALVMVASLRNRDLLYHDEIRHIIQATLLAQERMTASELVKGGFPDLGESSDRFEEPYDQYDWIQVVTPTLFDFAREVRVQVRWGPKPHESVELTSYVLEGV